MADLARFGSAAVVPRAARRDRACEGGPRSEYLVFGLAGEPYAAPVSTVREILKLPQVTPVPRAPDDVLGIVSVRGQLITVVDLRRRLRLREPARTRRSRVLLVGGSADETLGLLVDEVLHVIRLTDGEIEPATSAMGVDASPHIAAIARPLPSGVGSATRPARPSSVIVLLDLRVLVG